MDNGKSLPDFGVETQTHIATSGFSTIYRESLHPLPVT